MRIEEKNRFSVEGTVRDHNPSKEIIRNNVKVIWEAFTVQLYRFFFKIDNQQIAGEAIILNNSCRNHNIDYLPLKTAFDSVCVQFDVL